MAKKKTGTREWSSHSQNTGQIGCQCDCRYCYAREMAFRYKRIPAWDTWRHPVFSRPAFEAAMKKTSRKYGGVVMFPTAHNIDQYNVQPCAEIIQRLVGAEAPRARVEVSSPTPPVPCPAVPLGRSNREAALRGAAAGHYGPLPNGSGSYPAQKLSMARRKAERRQESLFYMSGFSPRGVWSARGAQNANLAGTRAHGATGRVCWPTQTQRTEVNA